MGRRRFGLFDHPAFWSVTTGLSALLLSLPLLTLDFWFDQGVFATIADTLLAGGLAYRDAWEHKPPGIFSIYGFAFLLLGRDIWAVRVVEMLGLSVASSGLQWIGERRFGSRASGVLAGVLLPLMYLTFGPNTAQPETFQIPLLVWAWALWPRGEELERRCTVRLFGAGLLLSLAILLKTPTALFAVVFLVDLLVTRRTVHRSGGRVIEPAGLVGGIFGPILLVSAYYVLRGASAPFWDALVTFPSEYARAGLSQSLSFHLDQCWRWIRWLPTVPELVLLAVGVMAGMRHHRLETLRCGVLFATAWASVILQARYFQYHYLLLLPFLSVLMSLAPAASSGSVPARARRPALMLWMGLAACSILVRLEQSRGLWAFLGSPASVARRTDIPGISAPWSKSRSVAERIRACTQSDDRIFVWGDEPLLYFLSHRRMAGPYPHLMPIVPEWRGPERLSSLLERFETESPKLVLVGPGQLWWRRYQTPKFLLNLYPDMKRMLEDRYRLVETYEEFEFWLRLD